MSFIPFSPTFLWGAATAAHQVEGRNWNNDWWDWEQVPGHIKRGDSSRLANDWYGGRYVEDFERARSLGLNTIRLSIEWSRIEPSQGRYDGSAVKYYRRMLQVARENELVPLVTLQHNTIPRWLAAEGGWENPKVVRWFSQFARFVVHELRHLCDFWVTLNEPNLYAVLGYVLGEAPPGKRDLGAAVRVARHLIRGHAGAYYAIHDVQPDARVGLAHHFRPFVPADPDSPIDRVPAAVRDRFLNWLIFDAVESGNVGIPIARNEHWPEVRGTQDFIGLNYYFLEPVAFDPSKGDTFFGRSVFDSFTSELAELFPWVGALEPRAKEKTLLDLAEFGKPIYITENGAFDNGRNLQAHYLVTHLAAVQRAIQAGADVRGYYWWTLVDNFEWSEGYQTRFGLYALDVESQIRTPRPVADVYARIIRERGIAQDLQDRYGRPN